MYFYLCAPSGFRGWKPPLKMVVPNTHLIISHIITESFTTKPIRKFEIIRSVFGTTFFRAGYIRKNMCHLVFQVLQHMWPPRKSEGAPTWRFLVSNWKQYKLYEILKWSPSKAISFLVEIFFRLWPSSCHVRMVGVGNK